MGHEVETEMSLLAYEIEAAVGRFWGLAMKDERLAMGEIQSLRNSAFHLSELIKYLDLYKRNVA